jgi:hypothetical protein
MASVESDVGAAVDRAWCELAKHWREDHAHRCFIGLCAQLGALDHAAKRYRAVRDGDGTRSDEARRRLDAVRAAAIVTLDRRPARAHRKRSRLFWLVVGGLLALAFAGGSAVLRLFAR